MSFDLHKPLPTIIKEAESIASRFKLHHVFFWVIYAIINTFFIRMGNNWSDSLLRQFPIMTSHALVVYFNMYYLVPKLLLHRQYFIYLIACLLLIGSAAFPISMLSHVLIVNVGIKGAVGSYFFLFLIFLSLLFSIILSMTIKLLKDYYGEQEHKKEMQQMQLQTELKYLKTQINPHFLFNSLNNVYALTLKKSELAPQMILRLSNILRYILEETSNGKVYFYEELKHLVDFVEMEKMRLDSRVTVVMTMENPIKNSEIEPMLYLTLVENAFKHGAQVQLDEGWVKIVGTCLENGYRFLVENSVHSDTIRSEKGGIGLINLEKRLNLSYPNKHVLTVENSDSKYSVTLDIIF